MQTSEEKPNIECMYIYLVTILAFFVRRYDSITFGGTKYMFQGWYMYSGTSAKHVGAHGNDPVNDDLDTVKEGETLRSPDFRLFVSLHF
jgi:hypothetical protein